MERNIYKIGKELFITNDEEINKDTKTCWCIDISCNELVLHQGVLPSYHYKHYKKIIMTTDKSINVLCSCGKDCGAKESGIQAIDDDFLEWFVKNPSCEKVLVTNLYGDYKPVKYEYKIIIPKEKQCTCKEHDPYCCKVHGICPKCNPKEEPKPFKDMAKLTEVDWSKFKKSPFHSKKEPKQETLEEAAEKYDENDPNDEYGKSYRAFIEGAKWQQEQEKITTDDAYNEGFENGKHWQQEKSYSEEDLREAFKSGGKMSWTDINQETQEPYYYDFNEWFEQYKKK